jgi:hypothetical protein
VATAHKIDEDAFTAMENMRKTRTSLLESTLKRRTKVLEHHRAQAQSALSKAAHDTAASSKKFTAQVPGAINQKAMKEKNRSKNTMKAEVGIANEEHHAWAMNELDQFSDNERQHFEIFQSAFLHAVPELAMRLDSQLVEMIGAYGGHVKREHQRSIVSSSEGRRRSMTPRGAAPRVSVTPPPREAVTPRGNRSLTPPRNGANVQRGSVTPPRGYTTPRAQLRGVVDQVQQRVSSELSCLNESVREPPLQSGLVDLDIDAVWKGPASWISSKSLTEPSILTSDTAGMADIVKRRQEADDLRSELKAAEVALGKGDWSDWGRDTSEPLEAAAKELMRSEANIEKKMEVLQKKPPEVPVAKGNPKVAEYAEDIRSQIDRLRNAKACLTQKRKQYARDAQQSHNHAVLDFEERILPSFSKLAHEAEMALEVAHALKRGSDRIPIGSVAGAWRRCILASLTILEQLWDGVGAKEEEREQFLMTVLDALLRAPGVSSKMELT